MYTLLQAGLNNALSATVLALAVASLGRILARRPAVLHCLWFMVLLKLVTPPLYDVSIPFPTPFRAGVRDARMRIVVAPEVVTFADTGALTHDSVEGLDGNLVKDDRTSLAVAAARLGDWLRTDGMPVIGTIWLVGTVTSLALSCMRIRRFQQLLNQAQPAPEEIQAWVEELSADLGLGRPPTVWWVAGKISPMLWALGRSPRLIVPIDLWKSLDTRQRATLLVHELAHLRRGDHHVRMFELVVTALYWWNPVLWWVRRALRDVEEQCCDAWVVWAFPDDAKSYAETLLETLDFLHQSNRVEPLLASGFGKVHHLRKRLTMIMNGNTPRSLSMWGALGSMSLAVVLLPLNASWAQKADEPKEFEVVVKALGEPDDATERAATDKGRADQLVRGVIAAFPERQLDFQVRTEVLQLDAKSPEMVIVRDNGQDANKSDGGKTRIHLELKTDGSTFLIEADSIPEAVKKLKDQIDALFSKTKLSVEDAKRAEILEKALKALGETARHIDETKSKDVKRLHRFTARLDELGAATRSDDKKAAERDAIRKRVESLNKSGFTVMLAPKKEPAKPAIEAKLTDRISLSLDKQPLKDTIKFIEDYTHLNVVLDPKALNEAGLTTELPVTLVVNEVPLKTALKLILRPLGLTYIVEDDVILITTPLTAMPSSSENRRIDELEQKLQKLLDEVASLKKEKSDAKK